MPERMYHLVRGRKIDNSGFKKKMLDIRFKSALTSVEDTLPTEFCTAAEAKQQRHKTS